MAKTIPQLTDATTVNAADELIIQQGGITKRATANELFSGTATVTSTGSTTGRTLTDRFADVVNVKDFGAVGDGVADDTAAISLALAAGQQIVFPHGDYLITTNITVGAGKALVFNTGASVTSTTTNTLNFNNNAELVADRSHIFKGSASCTNIKTAYPEWWGATHSTTTTSNEAFSAALTALKERGTLSLNNGFYAIDGTSPLVVSKGQLICGAGGSNSNIVLTTAATNLFEVTTTRGASFCGFRVLGDASVVPTSGTVLFYNHTSTINALGFFFINDLQIENVWNVMNFQGNNTLTLNQGIITNIVARKVYNYGFRFDRCENIISSNINLNADTGSGNGATQGGIILFNKCQSVDFASCMIGNCQTAGLNASNTGGDISRGSDVRWCQFVNCVFDDCERGADLGVCSDLRFVNCWFTSNGRTSRGYAGDGVWLRQKTQAVSFIGGVCSNNGQRGIRVESEYSGIAIRDMQLVGNSVNDVVTNPFYAIDIYGGVSAFLITSCMISGSDFGWSDGDSKGIQVRSGASDNYIITNNLIYNTFGSGNELDDSGSGSNKNIAGNITW